MYPRLYNSSGKLLAVLDNIVKDSATIKRVINKEFTFNFEALEKELKSEYFQPGNYIVVDDQAFDIKYIEQKHGSDIIYNIQCEHVNYRMEDGEENLYPSYLFLGTPTEILTDILSGTEFSIGEMDYEDVITLSVNSEITRKKLIFELAAFLGGEIEYTDNGFTINIVDTIGRDKGFQARFGKNLKGLTKIIDTRDGLKTYYEIDLIELKNSTAYINNDLQDLETVGVGDTIRIIDNVIGLDVVNRVVSIEYNPIFSINVSMEIANTLELITDKINEIETSVVKQDTLYNNVSISSDYGFRAERSDKLARATFSGGAISLDLGDGEGEYAPTLYFDALSGKYIFIGDIVMMGGTISWEKVTPPTAEDVGALPSDTVIPEPISDEYITTITQNTITTAYINALDISARRITSSNGTQQLNITDGQITFNAPMIGLDGNGMISTLFAPVGGLIRCKDIKSVTGTVDLNITCYFLSAGDGSSTPGGIVSLGNLTVVGAKNSLQKTETYGDRLINAYETADYYFGDIGSAIIGESGQVVIAIDEIFKECVNTDIEYHVFTQVYNGSVSSIQREPDYFVVNGTPGTEFGWELKAKRLGYENNRMEIFNMDEEIVWSDIEDSLNYNEYLENSLLEG